MNRMERYHIAENTVQETLIIPLYGRKLGSELYPGILDDPYSAAAAGRLDYDFAELDKKKRTAAWRFGALEGILRPRDILEEMKAYLELHPGAFVVNMGCGLDQTPLIGDNGKMRLYNIDRPDVIGIRNELLPPMGRETNIAADLSDPSWIKEIEPEEGVFLFAAGVFHYFRAGEVRDLVLRLLEAFPGGRLVFDTVGRTGQRLLMKKTLENMGISDISGYFCISDPVSEIGGWSDRISVSSRRYLGGYVDLKSEGVPAGMRLMCRFFDRAMNMNICRLEFRP